MRPGSLVLIKFSNQIKHFNNKTIFYGIYLGPTNKLKGRENRKKYLTSFFVGDKILDLDLSGNPFVSVKIIHRKGEKND